MLLKQYNKHERNCLITFPNTFKFVKYTLLCNSLFGVWKCGQTRSFVLDILLPARCNGLLFSPIRKTNFVAVLSFTTKFPYCFSSFFFIALTIGNRTACRLTWYPTTPSSSFANHSCDCTRSHTTTISVAIITISSTWVT